MELANIAFGLRDGAPLRALNERDSPPPTHNTLVSRADDLLAHSKTQSGKEIAKELADWFRLSKQVYEDEAKLIADPSLKLDPSLALLRGSEKNFLDREKTVKTRVRQAEESREDLTLLNERRTPGKKIWRADDSEALTAANDTWMKLTQRDTQEETLKVRGDFKEQKRAIFSAYGVSLPNGW